MKNTSKNWIIVFIFSLIFPFFATSASISNHHQPQKPHIGDFQSDQPKCTCGHELYLIETATGYNALLLVRCTRSMERFISRDPLGYVDGMGLYNGYFAKWGLVDPFGEKIHLVIVMSNETRDWKKTFDKNKKEILNFVEKVKKSTNFEELKAKKWVLFNGKPHEGSKQQYIEKVLRENESTFEIVDPNKKSGSLNNVMAKLKKLGSTLTEDYDELGLSAHGVSARGKWVGVINFGNEDHTYFKKRGHTYTEVIEKFNSTYKGRKVLISCGLGFLDESSKNENGVQSTHVTVRGPFTTWPKDPNKPKGEQCVGFNFYPFHIVPKIKDEKGKAHNHLNWWKKGIGYVHPKRTLYPNAYKNSKDAPLPLPWQPGDPRNIGGE